MSRIWSFFDPTTGEIHRRKFSGPDRALTANTPKGWEAIEGSFDCLSQRVDLVSREVVDWQPPKPNDEHEWNAQLRRWVLTPLAGERIARREDAQARIDVLERNQARALRELAINPTDATARQRLIDIETAIAAQRARLS